MIIGRKIIQGMTIQIHTGSELFATIWNAGEFYHESKWTPAVRRLVRNLVRVAGENLHTIPAEGLQHIVWPVTGKAVTE